jgi:DnaJ-class molecular chaperone
MSRWLDEFVASQIAAQRSADPRLTPVLTQARGMRLFGTMGGEVFLRPDGSVVALIEGAPGEPERWEEQSESDRIYALIVSLKRFPELEQLLPRRSPTADECSSCAGTGRIHGVVCSICSGLGWIRGQAT